MASLKIIVCGNVDGHFHNLFTKINNICNKKGKFECLLCVGSFFGRDNSEWKAVLAGKIVVPLTTYILGPNEEYQTEYYTESQTELYPNIIYLGKRGFFSTGSGLKIAFLSGTEDNQCKAASFQSQDVVEMVCNNNETSLDILLTYQWPKGVTTYVKPPEDFNVQDGSSQTALLAAKLKPRYHFSASLGVFYERLPYRNHTVLQEASEFSTRFIALAPISNNRNMKWLYAFNIVPVCHMDPRQLCSDTGPITECPYGIKNAPIAQDSFFFGTGLSAKHASKEDLPEYSHQVPKKRCISSIAEENCWFCFTNPNVEKHLILSIGEHSYLTLAKGGITVDHLLVIPFIHIQSSMDLTPEVDEEITKFKNALMNYFVDLGKDVIFFERNFRSSHLIIQVVPVPRCVSSNIKQTIFKYADEENLEFSELSSFTILKQVIPKNKPYFYAEIIQYGKCAAKLLHVISKRFPLQFGRIILANESVLNVPENVDWKSCKLSLEKELEVVTHFKKTFHSYDFTSL